MKESWNYFTVIFWGPKTNVTDPLLRKLHFIHQNINIHQYHSLNCQWQPSLTSGQILNSLFLLSLPLGSCALVTSIYITISIRWTITLGFTSTNFASIIEWTVDWQLQKFLWQIRILCLIPTFNIYYHLLSRLFYPDREHFHLFAALKDIVGSATPSSPGCREGGGSWSTSCPSWSSGHQDSSPVTHPHICK